MVVAKVMILEVESLFHIWWFGFESQWSLFKQFCEACMTSCLLHEISKQEML